MGDKLLDKKDNQQHLWQKYANLSEFATVHPELGAFMLRFLEEVRSQNLAAIESLLAENFYFDPGKHMGMETPLVEQVISFVSNHDPAGIASVNSIQPGHLRIATYTTNSEDQVYGDMSIEVILDEQGLKISKVMEGFQALAAILTGTYKEIIKE